MNIFGDKKEFAITYNSYLEQYADDPDVIGNPDEYLCGGNIGFWVKGKNLFAFKGWGPNATYGYYNLYAFVDFLTDYLEYHIQEVPFPIETKSTNAQDMIEETALVKSDVKNQLQAYESLDWSTINRDLIKKIDDWICSRTFLGNRGGTFLPDIMVRKVKNKIEISWNNRHPHDDGENKFYFLHSKGVEYVDAKLYKDVVVQFCLAYIEIIQKIEPELAAKYRRNLQKGIDVEL